MAQTTSVAQNEISQSGSPVIFSSSHTWISVDGTRPVDHARVPNVLRCEPQRGAGDWTMWEGLERMLRGREGVLSVQDAQWAVLRPGRHFVLDFACSLGPTRARFCSTGFLSIPSRAWQW